MVTGNFGFNNYLPTGIPFVFPAPVNEEELKETYLNSLDSDTKDYAMKHTDGDATKDDIEACVNRLHGE